MNTDPLQWAITFQWNDVNTGKLETKQIYKEQVSKHNHAIIIGRDDVVCDIVINNSSVSKKHVKIHFNERLRTFIINNLRDTNIPKLDNEDLIIGRELALKLNSQIVLGTQIIKVTDIQIYPDEPTNYSSPASVSANKINTKTSSSSLNKDDKSKSLQDKTIIAAIVAATATILAAGVGAAVTWYTNKSTQDLEKYKIEQQSSADKKKLYLQRYIAHREKVLDERKNNPAYNKLLLKNECSEPVYVAASFMALDEVLQTRGWLVIQPNGGRTSPGYLTRSDGIFLHASINKGDKESPIKWEGNKTTIIKRVVTRKEFDYIEEPFLDPNEGSTSVEVFYKVRFDFPPTTKDEYTTKTFKCDGGSLQLN